MIQQQVEYLGAAVGRRRACTVLGCARASWYRWHKASLADIDVARVELRERKPQPRALSLTERHEIRRALTSPRFCDLAPAASYAILLDEGTYLGSISTYYRVLREANQIHERRRFANGPNEVWSWDITRLAGPVKWTWFYLYVILDIFSRYIVGWTLARRETAAIAHALIGETIEREGIVPGQLAIHADRGSAMTSKPVAELYADLGITKSFSRPHTSNDTPFSEAQFKTIKYRPEFPQRFDSFTNALGFCADLVAWYNERHYHSGIALLTPAMVHHGRAADVLAKRQAVLTGAYELHPERFVRKPPQPLQLPAATYINPPQYDSLNS